MRARTRSIRERTEDIRNQQSLRRDDMHLLRQLQRELVAIRIEKVRAGYPLDA